MRFNTCAFVAPASFSEDVNVSHSFVVSEMLESVLDEIAAMSLNVCLAVAASVDSLAILACS